MNELMRVFDYEGAQVRTVIRDGQPWFVAKDVCNILEITNSRDAVARLDEDEKGVVSTDTPGGSQQLQAVTESGLYVLVLSSRKQEAKSFKRWVTHDVLPQIRQTGTYNLIPKTLPEALRAYANEVERRQALEAENLKMLPKAEFHDRVVATEGEMTMEAAAKELRTGRNRLFRELRNKRILKSNNLPMQEYLDRGYFRVVQNPLYFGENGVPYAQTMVTGKGLVWLSKQIADAGGLKRDA